MARKLIPIFLFIKIKMEEMDFRQIMNEEKNLHFPTTTTKNEKELKFFSFNFNLQPSEASSPTKIYHPK